jgi:hypothetical protein
MFGGSSYASFGERGNPGPPGGEPDGRFGMKSGKRTKLGVSPSHNCGRKVSLLDRF